LTAAVGSEATNVVQLLNENRGQSWDIGGDSHLESGIVTLPNILKKFSPDLEGFSTGTCPVLMHNVHQGTKLNVAVSGGISSDMASQARRLIDRIKAMPNYLNEWKLISLMIGGNDACDSCKNLTVFNPDQYVHNIKEALDMLHAELPKTFVNLVVVLDVSQVKGLAKGLFCTTLHRRFCACGAFPETPQAEREMAIRVKQYQSGTEALAKSGAYDTSDDFTVVVQPFLRDMAIPLTDKGEYDLSYFAPDCFHFSKKAQTEAAVALWNNMLQAPSQKQTTWIPGDSIKCPTAEKPYFATYKNSA